MRRSTCSSVLLGTLLLSASAVAQDLIVGPPGSGAAITSINAAILASTPGQRIRVLPGTYTEAVRIDRPVELIGGGSNSTLIQTATFLPFLPQANITILNIAPGQRVRVDGFTAVSTSTSRGGSPPWLVTVSNCAGRVELHDLRITGFNPLNFGSFAQSGLLTINDCAQVMADGLFVDGGAFTQGLPLFSNNTIDYPNGIAVVRSVAWFNETRTSGTASQILLQGTLGRSGAGLFVRDSRVYGTNLTANGAESGGSASPPTLGTGAPGLRIENAIVVLGGPRSTISGGSSVLSVFGGGVVSVAGSAVEADIGATLRYANDVSLVPGAPIAPFPTPPAIVADPMALIDPVPHRIPSIRLRAMPNPTTIPLELVLAGEPFTQHVRVIDVATQPAQEFPGTVGSLVIPVTPTTPLFIEPLGASGTVTLNAVLPNLPSLVGIQVVEQAAQIINNQVWLSPPTFATLLR